MMEMSEQPSFEGHRKPSHSLRIWRILTAISSLIAIVVAVVLIWFVVTHKSGGTNGEHQGADKDAQSAAILACPQLPTLFPLTKPTPKRIKDVLEKMESTLSS